MVNALRFIGELRLIALIEYSIHVSSFDLVMSLVMFQELGCFDGIIKGCVWKVYIFFYY